MARGHIKKCSACNSSSKWTLSILLSRIISPPHFVYKMWLLKHKALLRAYYSSVTEANTVNSKVNSEFNPWNHNVLSSCYHFCYFWEHVLFLSTGIVSVHKVCIYVINHLEMSRWIYMDMCELFENAFHSHKILNSMNFCALEGTGANSTQIPRVTGRFSYMLSWWRHFLILYLVSLLCLLP